MCYRRILPFTADGDMPIVAWVAGNERGCVAFQAGPTAVRLPYSTVDIGGVPWMAWDMGRHTPRPVADYDSDTGQAASRALPGRHALLLRRLELAGNGAAKRVVAAGGEDALWDELAEYFRSWISERDQED